MTYTFVDILYKEKYGISLSEAHKKQICIKCRKPITSEKLDEETKLDYEIEGLCLVCQNRLEDHKES